MAAVPALRKDHEDKGYDVLVLDAGDASVARRKNMQMARVRTCVTMGETQTPPIPSSTSPRSVFMPMTGFTRQGETLAGDSCARAVSRIVTSFAMPQALRGGHLTSHDVFEPMSPTRRASWSHPSMMVDATRVRMLCFAPAPARVLRSM